MSDIARTRRLNNVHKLMTAWSKETGKQIRLEPDSAIAVFECVADLLEKRDPYREQLLVIPDYLPTYFKERRLNLNLTMQDITDKTGVCKATISRIENGSDANYRTVAQIDEYLATQEVQPSN